MISVSQTIFMILYAMWHVTVVTQARVVCLICTPKARGLCYNYYVTLPFHAIGFTIFIAVLITFNCGYDVYSTFLTHLLSF